jgi:hypothetical protein
VVDGGHESLYKAVLRELTVGDVVPLLGAGVNLCNRPASGWRRESDFLPNGRELAAYLAETFSYPLAEPGAADAASVHAGQEQDERQLGQSRGEDAAPSNQDGKGDGSDDASQHLDLLRVSQYVATTARYGPLYRELRDLFTATHPWTPVHSFFAGLPQRMRALGTPRYQLIVTTNYDDQLERAFDDVGEQYDVVWYIADPEEQRGKFWHRPWQQQPKMIAKPTRYTALPLDERALLKRTLILKIHGAIDRDDSDRDSFVITEDHYIDYLTTTDIEQLLPGTIVRRLRKTAFLFLGYSMADWNLRVILHRIWGEQPLDWQSWAVRKDVDEVEEALWRARKVEVLDVDLEEFISELDRRLTAPAAQAVP